MSVTIPLFQIDAFASRPFEGNPAAVCFLHRSAPALPDTTLQAIAAENNLSETAFLTPVDGQPDDFAKCDRFALRWFTPEIEVPLCGHATLAAAAAVFSCAGNTAPVLRFDTASGELAVRRADVDGSAAAAGPLRLEMDLPLLPPAPAATFSPDFAADSALACATVRDMELGDVVYEQSLRYLLFVAKRPMNRTEIEGMKPKVAAMHAAHTGGQLVGVIVTAEAAEDGVDFYSRFFGPWAGIDEDPVTGSAHSLLGPYWAEKLGKKELAARQCSRRGGDLTVKVRAEEGRVTVSGGAVVVIRGELLLENE